MIELRASRLIKRAAVGALLCGAASLFAHFAWLSPAPAKARIGDLVTVRLLSGHAFPDSGEPVKDVELKTIVIAPSGKPVILVPADRGRGPEGTFKAEAEGIYRVVSEYDRGIISRTPDGWKPGGRSKNPNATSVIKSYNAFICAVRTSDRAPISVAPLGLRFEVSWTRDGRNLSVLATGGGEPIKAAEISAVIGSGDARSIGSTDAAGRIVLEIPQGFRGPILLIGSVSKPMPPGSDYETERLGATHFLTWE